MQWRGQLGSVEPRDTTTTDTTGRYRLEFEYEHEKIDLSVFHSG